VVSLAILAIFFHLANVAEDAIDFTGYFAALPLVFEYRLAYFAWSMVIPHRPGTPLRDSSQAGPSLFLGLHILALSGWVALVCLADESSWAATIRLCLPYPVPAPELTKEWVIATSIQDSLVLRGLEPRLTRHVVEVRDAQLAPHDWAPVGVVEAARSRWRAAQLGPEQESVRVEAAYVAAALEARGSGMRPTIADATPTAVSSTDFAGELAHVTRLAEANRESSIVRVTRRSARVGATSGQEAAPA
jgi:hypothetical protein